jgi:hypothetical protein
MDKTAATIETAVTETTLDIATDLYDTPARIRATPGCGTTFIKPRG